MSASERCSRLFEMSFKALTGLSVHDRNGDRNVLSSYKCLLANSRNLAVSTPGGCGTSIDYRNRRALSPWLGLKARNNNRSLYSALSSLLLNLSFKLRLI